ncbi:MAG: FeoB small GTPase domain-containing protein, partial [Gammaproteobacteria bacterium]
MSTNRTIALVGNPNCGKTTLFNRLTGASQRVGNWPGVTVERKSGSFPHAGREHGLVDRPGTFTLHVEPGEDSLDQQIAQAYVLSGEAGLLLNIVDATSLERGLFLSCQLIDAGARVVIALNMIDVADAEGIHIDVPRLAERMGCPVVPLVASRGEGIATLLDVIDAQFRDAAPPPEHLPLEPGLEHAITRIRALLPEPVSGAHGRLLAAAVLERDAAVLERLPEASRAE